MSSPQTAAFSYLLEKALEKIDETVRDRFQQPAYLDGEWNRFLRSSNVDAFKYDQHTEKLTIRFLSGREYEYYNIPSDMVIAFATAGSPGGWFHANLRGAPFTRLS